MTHVGKIARLPLHIRNQLNQRLQDGEDGAAILKWLNELPSVQDIVKRLFNGRLINKQNLSAWRLGGFRDWQRLQDSHAFMQRLVEKSDDLAGKEGDVELTDRLAQVAAGELARVLELLLKRTEDPLEQWKLLREAVRELVPLRAGDQRAVRLKLEQERGEIENDRYWEGKHEGKMRALKQKAAAPLWAALQMGNLASLFGGGETGRKAAAIILESMHDLEPGTLNRPARSSPVKPGQGQSNQNGPARQSQGLTAAAAATTLGPSGPNPNA